MNASVTSIDPDSMTCIADTNGVTLTIPADAIVSVERFDDRSTATARQPARLPPHMSELVLPLLKMFLKGSGALLDLVDEEDLLGGIRQLGAIEASMVSKDGKDLLVGLRECISYEHARISARGFNEAQRAHDRLNPDAPIGMRF